MTAVDAQRFSRQLALPGFTPEHQARLAQARVLVIGAGGLGSSIIPALAAAGVGTIGIVDDDTVETSNLHRQLIHGVADVGSAKVDSAAAFVEAISPATSVTRHRERLTSQNARDLVEGYDLLVDGSDNFPTRYLANDIAELAGIPLVWGAVSQYGGQASVSWATEGPTWRDLFPVPPAPGTVPSCEEGGVLPSVCAVIGSIVTTEVLKILTGLGQPLLGRVTTYDALTGSFREIPYARDPERDPVTGLIDYDLFCGLVAAPRTDPDAVTPVELERMLAQTPRPTLLDVREPWEAAIAQLPDSLLVPLSTLPDALDAVPRTGTLVVYCHHGVRSARALTYLRGYGFDNAVHLAGGIDAWRRDVQPGMAGY